MLTVGFPADSHGHGARWSFVPSACGRGPHGHVHTSRGSREQSRLALTMNMDRAWVAHMLAIEIVDHAASTGHNHLERCIRRSGAYYSHGANGL
jgi:hypothetical protein